MTLQFDDVTIKPSMCHGRVYTGSFVLDYHALYLQHFTSIEYKSHIELFRNGSVHELYRLKALITLEQVITSVVEKKNNLNKNRRKAIFNWAAKGAIFSEGRGRLYTLRLP